MSEPAPSKVRVYLSNAASSVVTRVLQLAMLVWVNQYLLKRISPEEYSLFPMVMALMVFASLLRPVFVGGISRYIVEADSRGDDDKVTQIVSSIFPIVLVVSLFFVLLGGIATWKLNYLIKVDPFYLYDAQIMFALLVFGFWVSFVTVPFGTGMYVRQRFVLMNTIDFLCEVLRIAVLLSLLFAVSAKVLWLVVATTVAGFASSVLRVTITHRIMPSIRFRRHLFSFSVAKKIVNFGAWTSVANVSQLLRMTMPVIFLNRFATPLDVAAFHLGRLPDMHWSNLVNAASVPAQPALTGMYANKDSSTLNDLYYRGGRYHLWLALLPLAPLMVFHRELIELYAGEQYASASIVMLLLFSRFPIAYSSAMYYRISHAKGQMRLFATIATFTNFGVLAAVYYAVAFLDFGAIGAAAAVFFTSSALQVLATWRAGLESMGGSWSRFIHETLVLGNAPFLAAIAASFIFGYFIPVDGWGELAGAFSLAILVYLSTLVLFCLDPMDRDLCRKAIEKIRKKS